MPPSTRMEDRGSRIEATLEKICGSTTKNQGYGRDRGSIETAKWAPHSKGVQWKHFWWACRGLTVDRWGTRKQFESWRIYPRPICAGGFSKICKKQFWRSGSIVQNNSFIIKKHLRTKRFFFSLPFTVKERQSNRCNGTRRHNQD